MIQSEAKAVDAFARGERVWRQRRGINLAWGIAPGIAINPPDPSAEDAIQWTRLAVTTFAKMIDG